MPFDGRSVQLLVTIIYCNMRLLLQHESQNRSDRFYLFKTGICASRTNL